VLRDGRITVHALTALPDGRILSGSAEGTMQVWDLTRSVQLSVFDATSLVNAVAVLDGRIVSGDFDHTVRVWDLAR
jgi:WD40 repeat protein